MLKYYEKEWLQELNIHINNNLENETFSQRDLAILMCVSPATLYRKVSKLSAHSPNQYIRRQRLKTAKKYLIHSNGFYNLSKIAKSVGYSRKDYFIKLFVEVFQKHPDEYCYLNNIMNNSSNNIAT